MEDTEDGFQAAVQMLVDEDGYFGRHCSSCDQFFKLKEEEYLRQPDDFEATCPYCGRQGDANSFITEEQFERAKAAAAAIALQMISQEVSQSMERAFSSSASSFVKYTRGTPPPIEELPAYIEEATRRVVVCPGCASHYAVYGATAFCPSCGARPATENVAAAIERGRTTLALEDQVGPEHRESLRDSGVLDGFAAEAIKQSVTLFEVLVEEEFNQRVPNHAAAVAGKGKIFQRLDDVDDLFADHAGFRLKSLVAADAWARLRVVFAQRHVLVHRNGIVDQKYLEQVPGSNIDVGHRLVVTRADAEQGFNDLEQLLEALAERPLNAFR